MRAILPPRFFMVFLVAVCVVLLSGCASKPTLLEAAAEADVNLVNAMIKGGAKANEIPQDRRYTPLCYLVFDMAMRPALTEDRKRREEEIVNIFITHGANVNEDCNIPLASGAPLHIAASNRKVSLAKLLLARGAKINLATSKLAGLELFGPRRAFMTPSGNTALMVAASAGDKEMMNFLISSGANTSLRDSGGNTARDLYAAYLERKKEADRQEEARREQERRDKAESREMWKGVATLATGVAVGKATSGYTPDQQTRMMSSSMKAVDSGDTSELTQTTNQVKAEQAQSHKAKIQAIEAQKERDRAAQSQNNQSARAANSNANSSRNSGNTQVAMNQNGGSLGGSAVTEDWKPAFKSKTTLTDCENRARAMAGSCLHQDITKPAFVAADGSATEQSKLCAQVKDMVLNGDFYNIVEDFGCGCSWINGYLSCTYFAIGKSRQASNNDGRGKQK